MRFALGGVSHETHTFAPAHTTKTMPFDLEQLRCVGIEPAEQRIIVVKSAIAWRAAYGPIAKEVIEVDTPGLCRADLRFFHYRRVRRPIFPLDDM